jgi:aldose sugar dehydrogenase
MLLRQPAFLLSLMLAALSPASVHAQTHIGGPGTTTKVWANNCAKCHSENGEGGPLGTPSLLKDELFAQELDRRFFDIIKHGVKPAPGEQSPMLGYAETMSDAEIWALVVHVRELQHAERRTRLPSPTPKGKARDPKHVFATQHQRFRIEQVAGATATKLGGPWAVDFLPPLDNNSPPRVLITERDGRLRVLSGTTLTNVDGLDPVHDRGQGGLLDVAVHPDFATNGWIYLSFSEKAESNKSATKVVRGKISPYDGAAGPGLRWTDQQVIFQARPESLRPNPSYHFGCRLAFDPPLASNPEGQRKGLLYFSLGDHGQMDLAQDLTSPCGKIHRVNDDGSIPSDNPFVTHEKTNAKVYPSIFSFGHRNPQGLVFDSAGNLFDTEHGPRGGDELNRVLAGKNYGWPRVAFSINYNDGPFKTPWPELDPELKDTPIELPVLRFLPSIAACGLAGPADARRWTDGGLDAWKDDLLAGGLAMNTVRRVRLDDAGKVIEDEEVVYGLGRVRDVVWGPDSKGRRALWVVTNSPDRIFRLVAE